MAGGTPCSLALRLVNPPAWEDLPVSGCEDQGTKASNALEPRLHPRPRASWLSPRGWCVFKGEDLFLFLQKNRIGDFGQPLLGTTLH